MKGRRTRILILVGTLMLPGCSSVASRRMADAALPTAPPVVGITMREYGFEYDVGIPAGRVVFVAQNAGRLPHRMVLVPLPDDVPPIDVQLRSTERRFVEPFAGFTDRAPGDAGSFAVDLDPGQRYAMICYVMGPDGQSHARKGMSSEFRTAAQEDGPTAPVPSSASTTPTG